MPERHKTQMIYGRKAKANKEQIMRPPDKPPLLLDYPANGSVREAPDPTIGTSGQRPPAALETNLDPVVPLGDPGQRYLSLGDTLLTPFPTEAGEMQGVFRLGTSKPAPDPPGYQLSPVPSSRFDGITKPTALKTTNASGQTIALFLRTRTTSRSLKENMKPKASPRQKVHTSRSRDSSSHGPLLASPFTSRPSSPSNVAGIQASRTEKISTIKSQSSRQLQRFGVRQTLSDTTLNQGITLEATGGNLESTDNCVERRSSRMPPPDLGNVKFPVVSQLKHQRRPSAPSLRLPPVADHKPPSYSNNIHTENEPIDPKISKGGFVTGLSTAFDFEISESYFTSSLEGNVDFNRPPSRMSLLSADIDTAHDGEDMFAHIRGRSTPIRARTTVNRSPPAARDQAGGADEDRNIQKLYSPWISDSIVSPPSYYKRQKAQTFSASSPLERSLEDMDLTSRTSRIREQDFVRLESGEMESTMSQSQPHLLSSSVPIFNQVSPNQCPPLSNDDIDGAEDATTAFSKNHHSHQRTSVSSTQKRSGTIVRDGVDGVHAVGKRNRSGTIIQGGGGARRTRSGTVVQAHGLVMPRRTVNNDKWGRNEISQDEGCSCCSSDDGLMLRSHSHYDLDAEDLEWKVADPPSPVIRRLRRAKRRTGTNKRNRARGKKGTSNSFGTLQEEDWEDGVEGDIDDDELDLLGTFVPENW